jgi:hypothetical protein
VHAAVEAALEQAPDERLAGAAFVTELAAVELFLRDAVRCLPPE